MPESIPDLTFPKMGYGTHQVPWDLRVLLHRGGAGTSRQIVNQMIAEGALGVPIADRLPLVIAIHGTITSTLEGGGSFHTVRSQLERMFFFFAWCDQSDAPLNETTAKDLFKAWTEVLLHRVRVLKDLSTAGCYTLAMRVATTLGDALQLHGRPGAALLRTTRVKAPRQQRKHGPKAHTKQNLEKTFEFGAFLADICDGLSSDQITGRLPIAVPLVDGATLYVKGCLKQGDPNYAEELLTRHRKSLAEASRSPIEPSQVIGRRPYIFNLRVEAELLIFCSQTGMNLAQAAKLEREKLRLQTDGEDIVARSYKRRRQGEVIFRAFKLYRAHLIRYLDFLHQFVPIEEDGRLFPFVYIGKIPAKHVLPRFRAVRSHSERAGLMYVGPRQLRHTRVNWLLRRSRDLDLTAIMSAHSKETLLAHYEEPHHQSAVSEITRFHLASDPTQAAAGPGRCADRAKAPTPIAHQPLDAPEPDCISPDGCLFCIHHRDVMTADYCWKLASHGKIKALELSKYKPPEKSDSGHPAVATIDMLKAKLDAIATSGEMRAIWVKDARDAVRSGSYHPEWNGYIRLLECFA